MDRVTITASISLDGTHYHEVALRIDTHTGHSEFELPPELLPPRREPCAPRMTMARMFPETQIDRSHFRSRHAHK